MQQMKAELVGAVVRRHFHVARVCEAWRGHSHPYDHWTEVRAGRLRIAVGHEAPEDVAELTPGGRILIKAGVRHTLKALEPDTRWVCEFQHRDFDGQVVEAYVGNPQAYGHDRPEDRTPAVVHLL